MSLYMDRHDGENLTPEAVAEGHAADLKLQDKYDIKFITYWYDDRRDSVFRSGSGNLNRGISGIAA